MHAKIFQTVDGKIDIHDKQKYFSFTKCKCKEYFSQSLVCMKLFLRILIKSVIT